MSRGFEFVPPGHEISVEEANLIIKKAAKQPAAPLLRDTIEQMLEYDGQEVVIIPSPT